MKHINIYDLMTWRRFHAKIFPYGSSILRCIISAVLVLVASSIFLYSLIIKQMFQLIGFLILCNMSIHLFMMKCVSTNPGIIPQILVNREKQLQLLSIPISKLNEDKKYLITNRCLSLYSKSCFECKILRPPRTIHCNQCNHCVEKYDHHCPWLSICIGYISSLVILTIYSFTISIFIIIIEVRQNFKITSFIIQIIIGAISLFFMFAIGRLLIYHLILIYNKRTTNEDLKNIFPQEIQLPFQYCSKTERPVLFDKQTQYFMDKSYRSKSFHEVKFNSKGSYAKQIMLTNMHRQLNDLTSSSTSVAEEKKKISTIDRYSITASQRTSIFNYLLEQETQNRKQ